MPRIFSKSCEYAIQATLYLSARNSPSPILLREISDSLGIPHHFLNKVLQQLSRSRILQSHKGSAGGFGLARPAGTILLGDIVNAIDGTDRLCECVLGFPECSATHPCPVHVRWSPAKNIITDMLARQTVAQLTRHFRRTLFVSRQHRTPS